MPIATLASLLLCKCRATKRGGQKGQFAPGPIVRGITNVFQRTPKFLMCPGSQKDSRQPYPSVLIYTHCLFSPRSIVLGPPSSVGYVSPADCVLTLPPDLLYNVAWHSLYTYLVIRPSSQTHILLLYIFSVMTSLPLLIMTTCTVLHGTGVLVCPAHDALKIID